MALPRDTERLSALRRISAFNGWVWPIGYGLTVMLFAWLMSNVPLVAMFHSADYDEGLFVRQAGNLLRGLWLGPYDNLTLAKGPFYPVWIAFGWLTGLPILVTQGLAYALSCLLLVRGLRPWLRSETSSFAVFLIILFNPATYSLGQLRVMREGIYVPLTMLLFALAAWWFRCRARPPLLRAAVAAGLGVVLGMFLCTREEGVWVAPPLAFCFVLLLLACLTPYSGPFRQRLRAAVPALRLEALLAMLALVSAAAVIGWFSWMNLRHYGVADIVELKQREFLSGYGALSRIRPKERRKPDVAITRETLARAYTVSPAAAELRPYFGGPASVEFVEGGCYVYNIVPCDGEIRTAWFIWALRDAVSQAGRYRTAPEARAYYARLGREIAAACDAGRLDCLPPRAALVPSFRKEFVRPTARIAGSILGFMVSQRGLTVPEHTKSCLFDDCGSTSSQAKFLSIVRTSFFVDPPWLSPSGRQRLKVKGGEPLFESRSGFINRGLDALIAVYRLALPLFIGVALAACVMTLCVGGFYRRVEPLFLVAGVSAVIAASRILMLAYIEAAAIPEMGMNAETNTLRLSPAYPALLLFGAAAILAGSYQLSDCVKAWLAGRDKKPRKLSS